MVSVLNLTANLCIQLCNSLQDKMQVDQEEGVQKSQAEQQNQADEETENAGTETKVCIQY